MIVTDALLGAEILDLIGTKEVARLLKLSERTIRLWAECSEIPAIRVGRQWRFRRDVIIQLIEVPALSFGNKGTRPTIRQ